MRTHHSIPVLIVFSMIAFVAPSNAEAPRQYLIEAKLTTTLPDGQEKTLCRPRVMTLEGVEAYIRVGETLAPPKGIDVPEPLRAGVYCRFKVYRNGGQVFLDANVNHSTGGTDADGVSIVTEGMRVVKAVTLDKKTTVAQKDWCLELHVHELQPKNASDAGAKETSSWRATAPETVAHAKVETQ